MIGTSFFSDEENARRKRRVLTEPLMLGKGEGLADLDLVTPERTPQHARDARDHGAPERGEGPKNLRILFETDVWRPYWSGPLQRSAQERDPVWVQRTQPGRHDGRRHRRPARRGCAALRNRRLGRRRHEAAALLGDALLHGGVLRGARSRKPILAGGSGAHVGHVGRAGRLPLARAARRVGRRRLLGQRGRPDQLQRDGVLRRDVLRREDLPRLAGDTHRHHHADAHVPGKLGADSPESRVSCS